MTALRSTAATGGEPKWRLWLEGAGAGILVAFPLMWLHLSPSRETLYHELLPMTTVYRGVLIDFVVVWLFSVLVFWLLDRRDPENRSLGWLVVGALLAMRTLRGLSVAELIKPVWAQGGRVFLVIVAAGLILWALRRGWYRGLMRGLRMVVLLLGFSVFWILPELAAMAVYPEPHETRSFSKPITQAPQQRIVWILFDELSYDQLFDHRQPGIDYPNFDRLASESVVFSDVEPAGEFTERVIPSLLMGETITAERSSLDGQLFIRTRRHPAWRQFPDQQTVFADAQRAGWSTGAVGWYNPYCRTDAAELNSCTWALTIPLPGHYSPDRSTLQNAVAPVAKSVLRLFGRRIEDPTASQIHAADYEHLLGPARAAIAGDRVGFLFVHLPLPHPGGFYNRKTQQIGVPGSYLDNLVLTDRTLGELLQTIDDSALGSRTTVVVSSDHSWRTWLWEGTSNWAQEDTRVSRGGHFDPRPVVMVHFPTETSGGKVGEAFPLIRMHRMLDGMIAGTIENAGALQAWAAKP